MSEVPSSRSQEEQPELDQSLIETAEELQLTLEEVRLSINTLWMDELTRFSFSLGLQLVPIIPNQSRTPGIHLIYPQDTMTFLFAHPHTHSLVPSPCAFIACCTKFVQNSVLQVTNTQSLGTRLPHPPIPRINLT